MLSSRLTSKKETPTHTSKIDQLGQEKERVKLQVLGFSRDSQDTSGIFNDIFSFNNQIAKGFLYCLQNQMNLAQIFMELAQSFESDKLFEYFSTKSILQSEDKMTKLGEAPSQDFFSIQNQTTKDKSLGFVSSKIEKMIGDLSLILSPYQPAKSDVTSDTFQGYLSTSPPVSSRNWTQDIKRGSMPVVIDKSKDFNTAIPSKNQPDYSIIDRRASTDNAQLVSGLKNPQNTLTESIVDPNNVKKFLKSKQVSLNKNKSTTIGLKVSPRNLEDIRDRSKLISLPFGQESSRISQSREVMYKNLERERSTSDKFTLKPTMGHIPRKDLVEESLNGEDRTMNSSASSHLMGKNNETAQMFKMPEFEENSLVMSLNNVKDTPVSEKKTIKELIREEQAEMSRSSLRGNEKKNLIEAKWWRAWKEYVNFDCNDDFKNIIIGIYPRPGRITNRGLLKYDIIQDFGQMSGDLELRDNLLEHHDYEVVSKRVFDLLSKWYGCDFELVRALKVDPFRKNKLCLDLYPEKGFVDIKNKMAKMKSVSPKGGIGNGTVISNIIQSNLLNYQGKSRQESKNAY